MPSHFQVSELQKRLSPPVCWAMLFPRCEAFRPEEQTHPCAVGRPSPHLSLRRMHQTSPGLSYLCSLEKGQGRAWLWITAFQNFSLVFYMSLNQTRVLMNGSIKGNNFQNEISTTFLFYISCLQQELGVDVVKNSEGSCHDNIFRPVKHRKYQKCLGDSGWWD